MSNVTHPFGFADFCTALSANLQKKGFHLGHRQTQSDLLHTSYVSENNAGKISSEAQFQWPSGLGRMSIWCD